MKATKVDKLTVLHPNNGILLSNKRNDLLSHEKTWRKVKCILLGERSQSEKATYYIIPTIWHSGKGKAIEQVKISGVPKNWGGIGKV